jgi:hypothetical protein
LLDGVAQWTPEREQEAIMQASRSVAALICLGALAILAPADAFADFTQQLQFGSGTTIPIAWGDFNNDGRVDLAVGHNGGANALFVNNGDGSYTQQAQFGSGATFAVAGADFDNDGDLDLAVGRGSNQQNYLFVNNGSGTFTQQSQFGLKRTIAVAWGDSDNDGDLDLAVGNGILGLAEQNYLYINNGDGTFTQQLQFGLGQTDSLVWGDFDNDGDLDLAVGNGGFGFIGQNYLYINNGNGTFTERAEFGSSDTASLAWGDCDNDGDLDMAVGNWDAHGCALYVNNGDGTFTGQAQFGSRDTNTIVWADVDNDGDLDVAVGNGDFTSADQNYIYVNNGDGTFTETAELGLGSTDSIAWADCDGDGDLDAAIGNEHSPGQNYLYVNNLDDGRSLRVRLVGHRHDRGIGYSNRDGVGAKVAIYDAGFVGQTDHLRGFREIEAHGGFSSENPIEAFFGVGAMTAVDLQITWPGSGGNHIVQRILNISVPQSITVDEAVPAGVEDPASRLQGLRLWPNPTRDGARIELAPGVSFGREVSIYSVNGALIRTIPLEIGSDGGAAAVWDGRTGNGRPAAPGVYLLHAQGVGRTTGGRLLRLP